MLKRGLFEFEVETANVYWYDEKEGWSEYPLRPGLSMYLWLLRTEREYFKKETQKKLNIN